MKNENELYLYEILNEAYPNQWVREHKGIEGRKFRFDCANPSDKIAIEIEGGIWMGARGGHTSGLGYEQNMEKYNLAVLEGWKVLRYSPQTMKKTPWKIISDIRKLCGVTDGCQTMLSMDGYKQTKIEQVQVRLS
jgi:very-short-patch-repair endonuclease